MKEFLLLCSCLHPVTPWVLFITLFSQSYRKLLIKTNKVRDYFLFFIRCNSNTETFFVLAVTLSSHHFLLLGELVTAFGMCSSPAGRCVWTTGGLLLASQPAGFAQEAPGEGGSWGRAPGWMYTAREPWVQYHWAAGRLGRTATVSPSWSSVSGTKNKENNNS